MSRSKVGHPPAGSKAVAERREGRLLQAAATFLLLYSIILTLSPAVRENSWNVSYRWSHWGGFLLWATAVFFAHRFVSPRIPHRDPLILPVAALLSGWGVLAIWRLDSGFGMRQALWVVLGLAALMLILKSAQDLNFLRRYKYLLLGTGLLLTALTLILGTNPTGAGPRLWLGCCGLYLQPSEPLKLLLVVYLAAYLADRAPIRVRLYPLLLPTLMVTSMALLLLIVQRDLGTTSIFILLYTAMLYLATEKRRVWLVTVAALALAGLIGYFFIDVVRVRLEIWLNPWNDPSGDSYQIVQSLLSIANGGIFGRGPGIGSPGLVPIAQSDFIYSSIAEETGTLGALGLLGLYSVLLARGVIVAIRASQRFHRLLAAGLTSYLGVQALLIIGGDLRMLPLTGVTLPFVSYGGSSLLTSFVAVALLLAISARSEERAAPSVSPRPYYVLAAVLGLGLSAAAGMQAWWALVRATDLLARTDNPRRSIADRYVLRGALLDRNDQPINLTVGHSGSLKRVYLYPDLAPISGYTHPVFGQAGLESTLDDYLRGLQGNPSSLISWDQLLSGTPPAGLDVRLSLDLALQSRADELLGAAKGAAVLLHAKSGEILVMASHPTYDPNALDVIGTGLANDMNAPLLNRAAQGLYASGAATAPFLHASGAGLAAGPPAAHLSTLLGFDTSPRLRLPVANPMLNDDLPSMHISPLQLALAAAALSNGGIRPAPRIALAVDTPQAGWVPLPSLDDPRALFPPPMATQVALDLAAPGRSYWEWIATAQSEPEAVSWYIAGTLPSWQGTPVALAVLIEEPDPSAARRVGQQLLESALSP